MEKKKKPKYDGNIGRKLTLSLISHPHSVTPILTPHSTLRHGATTHLSLISLPPLSLSRCCPRRSGRPPCSATTLSLSLLSPKKRPPSPPRHLSFFYVVAGDLATCQIITPILRNSKLRVIGISGFLTQVKLCKEENKIMMLLMKRSGFFLRVRNCHYHAYRKFNEDLAGGSDIKVIPFGGETDDPLYTDLPERRKSNSERKPYPTPMKTLISRAKQEKELRISNPCRVLEHPPDNGLLVSELVQVSHQVYWARESLLIGISKLLPFITVFKCRLCPEVHIGHMGHEIRTCTGPRSGFHSAMHDWRKGGLNDVVYFPKCFHLYDRVGKSRVTHDERFDVQRIPAILELCIQAGINFEKYPVKRRTKPVYSIEGRIVDFDAEIGDYDRVHDEDPNNKNLGFDCRTEVEDLKNVSEEDHIHPLVRLDPEQGKGLKGISIGTMASWLDMIFGARKIMERYSVWTCGYCPEVQVGPKGHKVRMCKASKHQSRDGLHAWQEATIDDLVGPNYVWHVRDPSGPPLSNKLKRYYGKAPAVVELCVQAGAPVPDQYRSMMRLDVVPPDLDEVDLVG